MKELKYIYSKFYEKTIKEWEYLRREFKDYPIMVDFINKTIIDLKRIAIPTIVIKKTKEVIS